MSKYKDQLAIARIKLRKDQAALAKAISHAAEVDAQYISDWKQADHLLMQIEGEIARRRQAEHLRRPSSFLGLCRGKRSKRNNLELSLIQCPDLSLLRSKRSELLDRMEEAATRIGTSQSLVGSIEGRKAEISRLENCVAAEVERNEQLADSRLRKESREHLIRAKAAAHDESSRALAAQLKRRLERQACCPYCGDNMTGDAHADHIYPLSKGGLSTPVNLVYVCVVCNMKKSDLTLISFIRKFDLDREVIECRLLALGKDF